MLLRKHLSGGKIIDVLFYDFERIISIIVESTNEMGDLTTKKLIIEIMGKHSNIILVNDRNRIIDSIKHVDSDISSIREVMPGRLYMSPPTQNKISPLELDSDSLFSVDTNLQDLNINAYLLNNIRGFSPLICKEICFRADISPKTKVTDISKTKIDELRDQLIKIIDAIRLDDFKPCIFFETNESSNKTLDRPLDFYCFEVLQYKKAEFLKSLNEVLDIFYTQKDKWERIKSKTAAIYKIINTNIDRCNKKHAIYTSKCIEVQNREQLKLFGELILANIYSIPEGSKFARVLNYYQEDEIYIEIPLDESLALKKNATRYFKKYTKAKAASVHAEEQLAETKKELIYLESVLNILESCSSADDIAEIKEELVEAGYLNENTKNNHKKQSKVPIPLQFKSTNGFQILVGKNNKQNDYLTLKYAQRNDIWMHTKDFPGSHVIIKTNGQKVSDQTLLEAANFAALYSKAKNSTHVEVDYTFVKHVKKPSGAKPGMVIYKNYSTIAVDPKIQ